MGKISRILKISIVITLCIQVYEFIFVFNTWATFYPELKQIHFDFIFTIVLTTVTIYFHDYADKKYSWKTQGNKRLLLGIIGGLIITIITIAIIRMVIIVGIFGKNLSLFVHEEKISFYLTGLIITLIASSIFHAFYFYKELQKQKITEQKIIAGTASAQFSALKNQLDPHFLFNSLNVLTSLIEEDQDLAQKFTTSLSKVYRYVLEQKNKELVSVEEELKFAKTYMTLLKLRFEDSIIFNISENITNPEAKIVPLSLQILLENSVKHNIVTPERPLKIEIYEKDNFLFVENNLQPKEVIKKSTGVGLSNVKQRYSLVTKREFSVYKTKEAFIAELPLLTKQTKIITSRNRAENIEEIKNLKYQRAKNQVKKIKEFYINLITFACVIPFLAILNYNNNGFNFPWVLFPFFGWGLGLFFQSMEAFNYHPVWGKNWEEKRIKKYINTKK